LVRMDKNHYGRQGSVAEPRAPLLQAVLRFVLDARICQGVLRMALIGSLTTAKPLPKDADVLVTIEGSLDLGALARAARRLKGTAQQMNLGADIFLANAQGGYVGRICHYRECLMPCTALWPAGASQRRLARDHACPCVDCIAAGGTVAGNPSTRAGAR
jgi:hypothetical protein